MAKPTASESIMPADKMKPILAKSKQEPVQAALGLTAEGDAVLLLDKKRKPRAVAALLKSEAAKAKVTLQPATIRFGRAEVDTDYDATMVRLFLNKEAPGMMRAKLVEVVRKAAFQKVELNVDASLEEDEAQGEGAQGEEAGPAAEAPGADAAGEEVARLHAALAELAKGIPAVAGTDAGRRTTLLKAAGAANDALKAHDVAAAGAGIEKLRRVMEALAAAGAGGMKGAAGPLLPIWTGAKESVDAGLGKLQGVLRDFDDPDLNRIAEFGLNGITGKNSVGLMTALREADGASDKAAAHAKLTKAIEGFRSFLDTDRTVALIDDNPFGVPMDVRGTLGEALDTLTTRMAA